VVAIAAAEAASVRSKCRLPSRHRPKRANWDLEFPKRRPRHRRAVSRQRNPAMTSSGVGPLDISHGLYSIFLSEADECIRVLANDVAEWRYEPARAVTPNILRRAHSLCGISRTVGLAPVVAIADPIDELMRTLSAACGRSRSPLAVSTRWSV
jgi:hypothetical protein